MAEGAAQFLAGGAAGVAVLLATVRLPPTGCVASMSLILLARAVLAAAFSLRCVLLQHWIDTLKLLGQQGPIDWAALRRNPFKLYAGITPAVLETAAYK